MSIGSSRGDFLSPSGSSGAISGLWALLMLGDRMGPAVPLGVAWPRTSLQRNDTVRTQINAKSVLRAIPKHIKSAESTRLYGRRTAKTAKSTGWRCLQPPSQDTLTLYITPTWRGLGGAGWLPVRPDRHCVVVGARFGVLGPAWDRSPDRPRRLLRGEREKERGLPNAKSPKPIEFPLFAFPQLPLEMLLVRAKREMEGNPLAGLPRLLFYSLFIFFLRRKASHDKAMQRQTSPNQRDAPGQDTGRSQGHLSSYLLGGAPGESHRARCRTDSRGCDTHCGGRDERPTQNLRSTGQETHRATGGSPVQTWNAAMTRNQLAEKKPDGKEPRNTHHSAPS